MAIRITEVLNLRPNLIEVNTIQKNQILNSKAALVQILETLYGESFNVDANDMRMGVKIKSFGGTILSVVSFENK